MNTSPKSRLKDITGRTFGRLTALRFQKTSTGRSAWICRCSCGNDVHVLTENLKTGNTQSCGCRQRDIMHEIRTSHGDSVGGKRAKEYMIWLTAKQRTCNPNNPRYPHYGARGITMCERWKNSYEAFLEDMGRCPDRHQLERINNDGNYEPSNCKWATKVQQMNNMRTNFRVTHDGRTQTVAQWAREFGMSDNVLRGRLHLGWSFTEAVSTPVIHRK